MSHFDPMQSSAAAAPRDTFATYLAKQFIAKKGFAVGTVPEASELAAHCDVILSRQDGYALTIACLVDREAHPGKIFDLSPYMVDDIGEACLKYTGKAGLSKMPVVIDIFEVGPGSPDDSQRRRLAPYRRASLFSKVVPRAWIVDTASAAVWSNLSFGGRLQGRGFIQGLLGSPRESDADLQAAMVVAAPKPSFPWLTCALLTVLIAVFAAEVMYGIGPWSRLLQPSIATLLGFGGLTQSLVLESGQWYRLFSAPLLHADLAHLLMNGVALVLAGRILEGLVGRAWFAAIFVVGALCGSILSLALNPPTLVSVGASGAVMGLFAAILAVSLHFPSGAARTSLQVNAIYVLVPSLLPLASMFKDQQVDYAAHFGGALGGAAIGLLLLAIWPKSDPRPRLSAVAVVVALAGLLAFAFPLLPLVRNYSTAALGAALIPSAHLPKSDDAAKAQSADLVARYPRDPRARLFRAIALWDAGDRAGTERELRAGLAEEDMWRPLFTPELSARLRTILAVVVAEDRPDEARRIAEPICSSVKTGQMRALLDHAKLCGT